MAGRVDTCLADGLTESDVDSWVQSASLLHSNGDAMDIAVQGGRIVGVRGGAEDRVNRGRLDVKDLYGWQANNSADRPTRPLVREGDGLVECDWDTAMGRIVDRSRELLAQPGGWGRFGFYTSGQLFLEEYYTLAVIGKAGIGTPPHGRQHPAVYRHCRGGAQGQLRRGRAARLLHRRGLLRHDRGSTAPSSRPAAPSCTPRSTSPPPRYPTTSTR